jgi:hypothetical protein
LRYRHGKDDSLDAEGAARSVLSGEANAQPKTQSGSVEMIRQIKLTRDTAVKSRSLAMITLKTLIINAPSALREQLDQIRGSVCPIPHKRTGLNNRFRKNLNANTGTSLADA